MNDLDKYSDENKYNSNDSNNIPQEGTKEYDEYMKKYFGDDYELGYRVGFPKRVLAAIIDFILVFLISSTIFLFTDDFEKLTNLIDDNPMELLSNPEKFSDSMIFLQIIVTLISLVYYSSEIFIGATLGKLALNLKIASENRFNANLNQLLFRFFIKNINLILGVIFLITGIVLISSIGSILSFVVFIGFFFTLSRYRQSLHDKLSKTAVFNKTSIKNN